MKINVRINKDDNKTFRLVEFNASYFNSDGKLKLITDDIRTVKNMFSNLESVEVFINDNLVVETNSYDGYSSISYLGTIFCDYLNTFVDCLEVILTKVNLVDEVERIKNIVEPVIDIDSMSLNELKEYKKRQISLAGSEDIYAGDTVTFNDGTTEFHSFSSHDQQNLQTYLGLIGQADPDQRKHLVFPYHQVGGQCTFYTYDKIVTIFFTLQLKLLDRYTRVNMLRLWVDSLTTTDQVKEITYETELPEEYEARKAEIMAASIAGIMEMKKKYGLIDEDESSGDEEPEPTSDSEVNAEE